MMLLYQISYFNLFKCLSLRLNEEIDKKDNGPLEHWAWNFYHSNRLQSHLLTIHHYANVCPEDSMTYIKLMMYIKNGKRKSKWLFSSGEKNIVWDNDKLKIGNIIEEISNRLGMLLNQIEHFIYEIDKQFYVAMLETKKEFIEQANICKQIEHCYDLDNEINRMIKNIIIDNGDDIIRPRKIISNKNILIGIKIKYFQDGKEIIKEINIPKDEIGWFKSMGVSFLSILQMDEM